MKIFNSFYSIKQNEKKIKIFNHAKKYKKKCKIIYKNKIYSLQSKFEIKDNEINQLKIKLISYADIFNPRYLIEGCKSLIDFDENIKYKKKEK